MSNDDDGAQKPKDVRLVATVEASTFFEHDDRIINGTWMRML